MWIKENVILTNVKKIYRTGFGINIEFENNFSAECPELKDKIFWEFIDNCISKDLTPLRLELVSYNLINKALFNFARYVLLNYKTLNFLHKNLRTLISKGNKNIELVITDELISDEKIISSFYQTLRQLISAKVIEKVEYITTEQNKIIKIENILAPNFFTGEWIEIALVHDIKTICPFKNYTILKNFIFSFKGIQNESDILLITEKGHFLFEIKTDINRLDENIYYKLLRIANLLGIKNNRVFLVIVDLEISDNNEHLTEPENKEENILRTLIQEFEGINVCSIKETKNLLKREFYKMLIEK